MAAFNYRALDPNGRELRGVLEAETSRHARGQLRAQDLYPVSVAPVGRHRTNGLPFGPARFGNATLALLTQQWSALLSAGLPIEQSLTALIEQTEDAAAAAVFAGVRAEVVAGHSLQTALSRFEDVFPPIYRALINAGEKSGALPRLLSRLAQYLESQQSIRRKILQALLYPMIVTVVALAVIAGLVAYVVPQIVGVFQQSKQALPLLTQVLIFASEMLRAGGLWLAVGLAIAAILARRALRNEALRLRLDSRLLRLAVIGRFLRTIDSSRFASTLAILIESGVPLLAALEAGKGVISNRVLRRSVEHAIERVREGSPLARALAAEGLFPPLLIHLVASGETSGALEEMLARAAHQQNIEFEHRTALALGLLEPFMILFMGCFVLLIVLAVLLPIIDINLLLR
ncbi:MAG: type II secretion system protein GspF [Betaproteobacteria bacterium]|nr:type II secretion system protein GspF [Betaproteobacteria bacterium]